MSPSERLTPRALRRLRIALYTLMFVLAGLVVTDPVGGQLAAAVDPPTAVVAGTVFEDRNGNDAQDAKEPGLEGVTVSDGRAIVRTGPDGSYRLETDPERRHTDLVFLSQPAGYSVGADEFMTPRFYRELGQLVDGEQRTADFALTRDTASESSNFSFGNIADPHFNANMREQVRQVSSTATNLGFIQVSGDLTNNATDAEFGIYKAGTAESSVPVWPAVGNHEYFFGGATDYASRIDNYRRHVGPEWYSFDYGDRHFLVLENNGQAPFEEQLAWVRRDLELNAAGKKLVVLAHMPMNVPFGSPSVYDAYGEVFEQYGAELMLVGHEHSNDVEPHSEFASTAKHVQTNSSSYTIDHSPRGYRYVHMTDESFTNPFRMYGADQTMTITSPAPGSSVPAAGFPGIQVNAYDTADEVASVRYRLDGGAWQAMKATGEFTWHQGAAAPPAVGKHTVEVEAIDDAGHTWSESSSFELTSEPALAPVAGADWVQHHGDARHSGVSADALPADVRLAWSHRTEGTFLTGSPAIVDGVVYAGTRDENGDGNSAVHAVRLSTGERLWSFPVPSSVHGSLAVGDGTVFVPSMRGVLYAVDAETGKLRWKHAPEQVAGSYNQRAYGYYGPTVAGGKVFWPYQTRLGAGSQGLLVALDTRTGDAAWQAPMTGSTMSDGTPAVADGMVYVGNQTSDRVIAFDQQTGERRWVAATKLGGWQDGIPTAVDGRVFIGANNGVIARDGATGQELWTFSSPHPSQVPGGATPSAPAVAGNVLYMGFPSGAVTALDATTGAVLWDRVLPGTSYRAGVASSPVVSGDTLFVGSNNGSFYALDRHTGQPRWEHEIGTWVAAGPAVSGNTVVTGAWDGNLYAYTGGRP